MDRNSLRKIKYGTQEDLGYLHGFFTTGNNEEGFYITALIETKDGYMTEYDAVSVVFYDWIDGE